MSIVTVLIKEPPASKIDIKIKLIELSTTILLILISFKDGVEKFN